MLSFCFLNLTFDEDPMQDSTRWKFEKCTFKTSAALLIHIYVLKFRTIMDADGAFFVPEFLMAFIEKYRSLSCLWNVKSSDYCNSLQRQRSWEELCAFCEKVNPIVTSEWVKKKVHNIRNSFRKELKKVRSSGAGAEETYKPKLWYYELMLFLCDNESTMGSFTAINSDDETACAFDENIEIKVEGTEVMPQLYDKDKSMNLEIPSLHWIEKSLTPKLNNEHKSMNPEVPNLHWIQNGDKSINPDIPDLYWIDKEKRFPFKLTSKQKDEEKSAGPEVPNLHWIEFGNKSINPDIPNLHWIEKNRATCLKRKKQDEDNSALLKMARGELEKKEDEYEAIGKAVAAKLRKIGSVDYMQFIYADKIINDVLYKALLQQLSPSDIINKHVPQISSVPNYSLNIISSPSSSQSCQGWPLKSSPASSHTESDQSPSPSIS